MIQIHPHKDHCVIVFFKFIFTWLPPLLSFIDCLDPDVLPLRSSYDGFYSRHVGYIMTIADSKVVWKCCHFRQINKLIFRERQQNSCLIIPPGYSQRKMSNNMGD